MDPATVAILTSLIGAGGSALGGLFGRKKNKETPIQTQQRSAIDEILAGIKGEGPFAGLFAADQDTFQKSYVDPAKSMFEKQIAPQIQQEFIASGQQRGTGLEDTLSRAGVDLDMALAQQYGQFQESAQQRQLGALGGILGQAPGVGPDQSRGSAAGQGFAGYLSSPGFGSNLSGILDAFSNRDPQSGFSSGANSAARRGFIQ